MPLEHVYICEHLCAFARFQFKQYVGALCKLHCTVHNVLLSSTHTRSRKPNDVSAHYLSQRQWPFPREGAPSQRPCWRSCVLQPAASMHPHTHIDTLRGGASIAGGSSLTYEPQPSLQLPQGRCHTATDERRCGHVKSSPLTSYTRPWRPKGELLGDALSNV